jgi:hypothetical protein
MKTIAVGDIHGRDSWKRLAEQESFDQIIFLGDYFDSKENISAKAQMKNFKEILLLKAANPEKVVLLIGNHDFHYMPLCQAIGEWYSGFQSGAGHAISHLLQKAKDLLQVAYWDAPYLFTHAGVTNTWLRRTLLLGADEVINLSGMRIDDYINDVFQFTPKHFLFEGWDSSGDDPTQSPIWVRPASLNEDAYPAIHVVGHTQQPRIVSEPIEFSNGGGGFFIDTLGTSEEYLVIEDGNAGPRKLKQR